MGLPVPGGLREHGQVIDVLLSIRRDLAAVQRLFTPAMRAGVIPAEVTTDRAPAYPRVPGELIPSALHTAGQYANNPAGADHGRLKARLRPVRGLYQPVSADPRRRSRVRPEPAPRPLRHPTGVPGHHRLQKAFDDLAITI